MHFIFEWESWAELWKLILGQEGGEETLGSPQERDIDCHLYRFLWSFFEGEGFVNSHVIHDQPTARWARHNCSLSNLTSELRARSAGLCRSEASAAEMGRKEFWVIKWLRFWNKNPDGCQCHTEQEDCRGWGIQGNLSWWQDVSEAHWSRGATAESGQEPKNSAVGLLALPWWWQSPAMAAGPLARWGLLATRTSILDHAQQVLGGRHKLGSPPWGPNHHKNYLGDTWAECLLEVTACLRMLTYMVLASHCRPFSEEASFVSRGPQICESQEGADPPFRAVECSVCPWGLQAASQPCHVGRQSADSRAPLPTFPPGAALLAAGQHSDATSHARPLAASPNCGVFGASTQRSESLLGTFHITLNHTSMHTL